MKLILPLLWYLGSCIMAKSNPIIGTIKDAETKEPLAFANIRVVGKNTGTISNIEGQYLLNSNIIEPTDTIEFSFLGYKSLKISFSKLTKEREVYLQPIPINLKEVEVSTKTLTVKDIITRIRDNYDKNYPVNTHVKTVFFHKYEKTPFTDENQIEVKESDFEGLDKTNIEETFDLLPESFIEYQDAILELYSCNQKHKVVPLEAISLEESSLQDLSKELERRLGQAFEDIKTTNQQNDLYYKFRSGIFSIKAKNKGDSVWNDFKNDTLYYHVKTEDVKNDLTTVINDWSTLNGKNWEFLTKMNKYNYLLERTTAYKDELAYEISFTPKRNGLFEGKMLVSNTSYAILQLDFAYALNKSNENFHLLGIGHSMLFKKGRIVFERAGAGYYLKYISAHQHEKVSIDRSFTIMKKKSQFLIDKKVNEVKLKASLVFDTKTYRELLILDHQPSTEAIFNEITEPKRIKFKKEYTYQSEMWKSHTVITPLVELKKYKIKEK